MATASRKVRKLRRLKRERTLAYKGMDLALRQRDLSRMISNALEKELKKYTDDPFPEDTNEPTPLGTIASGAAVSDPSNVEHSFTMTVVDDEHIPPAATLTGVMATGGEVNGSSSFTVTKLEDEEISGDPV